MISNFSVRTYNYKKEEKKANEKLKKKTSKVVKFIFFLTALSYPNSPKYG